MREVERLGIDDLLGGQMHGNEAARRFYERRGSPLRPPALRETAGRWDGPGDRA